MNCKVLSSIPDFHSLEAMSTSPSKDNLKCLSSLPNTSRGQNCPQVRTDRLDKYLGKLSSCFILILNGDTMGLFFVFVLVLLFLLNFREETKGRGNKTSI